MSTIEQRMAEYEDAYKKSQSFDMSAFQNDFQKAYGEATNYNQDLINQQSSSLGELQAVAPTLREKYSNSLITDPTKQMALIAQARQAPITNWGNAVNLLSARGNKYQDILGKALGGYQTAAQQANANQENAWRLYQDAVSQEQARRAAASSSQGFDLSSLFGGGSQVGATPQEAIYEIDVPDTALNPNVYTDRLAQNVTDTRNAQGFGDVLGQYFKTAASPLQNIRNIGDVAQIPIKTVASNYTILSDLFNRIFKK